MGISAGIHLILFFHMAGIYESRTISYIELSMQGISNPVSRRLPSPRPRRRPPAMAAPDTSPLPTPVAPAPHRPTPVAMDSPRVPSPMDLGQFSVPAIAAMGAQVQGEILPFSTAREYFELLNLRINQNKSYPSGAKFSHLEGRAKVKFTLDEYGMVSNLTLVKSSRHPSLDAAALKAVEKSTPFPIPPQDLLKPPLTLQVSILFELT